jgi:hypothetical protein
MLVNVSPSAASEVSVATLSKSIARTVDPAFEEHWNAWPARGHQHEFSVRRQLRFVAVAVVIAAPLVISELSLWGGSL